MPNRRDIRRLAMQVLYQIDLTPGSGQTDRQAILDGVDQDYDSPAICAQAVDLALAAWEERSRSDEAVRGLTPDWPTHRQPPVDRAILRLAYYEMTSERSPIKVAINEAVELAKQYGAKQSPAFINGVLDKLARSIATAPTAAPSSGEVADATNPSDTTKLP